MKKVAITGTLSSGKTTACQFFKTLGAYIVSADEIVHHLLSSDASLRERIIELLGPTVLTAGKLDRKKIAERVFSQERELDALEKIIHPAVYREIEKIYQHINHEKKYSLFIVEIPLLYETKQEHLFDAVIAISTSRKLSEDRHPNKKEFALRMKQQLPGAVKVEKADYQFENNGSINELQEQVKALYSQLTENTKAS